MKLHSSLAKGLRLLLVIILISGCSRTGSTQNNHAVSQPQRDAAQPSLSPSSQTKITAPTRTAQPSAVPTATSLPALDRPLIWYLRGSAPADLAKVNERLNRELSLRGFGAQVELRVFPPGDFDRRIAETEKPGEAFDLISLNAASYTEMLEKEALLPLNAYRNPGTQQNEDLLKAYATGLQANLPATVWSAWVGQGKTVFAVPNQGEWVRPAGVAIRADMVQALNLQPDLDAVRGYADLTPLFAKIQQAIKFGGLELSGIANAGSVESVFGVADLLRPEVAGYDLLAAPFAVRYNDPNRSVLNWFASEDFQRLAELRRAWQEAGYGPSETMTPEEILEGYQTGKFVAAMGRTVGQSSGLERYGYAWIEKAISPAFIPSAAPAAALTGISAKIAGQPERIHRVMLLLEWLHTDAKLYNLLAFGIEGDHWSWADREQGVITLLSGSRYRPDFVDQIGDRTLAYATDIKQVGRWKTIREQNANRPVSPVIGFVFHPRRVAGEVAALKGLTPEWLDPLSHGEIKNIPSYIQRMIKDLDAAGLKAIEAEIIEQMGAAGAPE